MRVRYLRRISAAAITSYLASYPAAARPTGRQALAGLTLAGLRLAGLTLAGIPSGTGRCGPRTDACTTGHPNPCPELGNAVRHGAGNG
jgi:hypothetical protein